MLSLRSAFRQSSSLRLSSVRLMSSGTPPKTADRQNDGSPGGYTIPPKESTSDKPLPKSQDEHPGPKHEDGEEHKKK